MTLLPRATITDFGTSAGKSDTEVTVRAATKIGAILTARLASLSTTPLREQETGEVHNLTEDRLLNQWVVHIQDSNSMENIGR